jgi:glycosyltransferase involved in cell wall biosynthesis
LTPGDIENIKKEGTIRYLGHVDNMPKLIKSADIVVLPSYREGTPKILIEAASMEKPIVATDIPGCSGLVQDGVNGFLVHVKNAEQLAGAIRVLAENEVLRLKMGKAGRNIVINEFDEESVIKKTLSAYGDLLAKEELTG